MDAGASRKESSSGHFGRGSQLVCFMLPRLRWYNALRLRISAVAALSYLFRIDTDGSVHVADEGIRFSNGLAFSLDCSTLYFSGSVARCIHAYDWNRETGKLTNRRVFVRVPREHGFPDGLTVDAESFLWCAQWFGARITRYDPDGKVERIITLPATQTSSLAFGRPDLGTIFVTSASLSNMLWEAPPGYDPDSVFVGGRLYQMRRRPAEKTNIVVDSDASSFHPIMSPCYFSSGASRIFLPTIYPKPLKSADTRPE
jgi:hypothetical protein